MTISFARHQFPPAVIQHAVWLYIRFTLIQREFVERSLHKARLRIA
jgi:transposase-like protein